MLLSLIIFGFAFYKKDKKELAFFSVPKNKKKFYDEIRIKLNESQSLKANRVMTMTFSNLYAKIYAVFLLFYIYIILLNQF